MLLLWLAGSLALFCCCCFVFFGFVCCGCVCVGAQRQFVSSFHLPSFSLFFSERKSLEFQTSRQRYKLHVKKKGFIFFSCLVFFLFFYFSIFLFFRVKIESKNLNKEFPTVWWHQPAGSGDFSVFDCQPFPCNRCPNGASINN